MRERQPIMIKTMKFTDARQQLSQVLNQVFRGETRVLVEKNGIPVAGIVSAQDLERFRRLEQEREKNFAILDEIGEAFKGVPAEEIEREATGALRTARKKLRTQAGRVVRTS